MRWRLLPFTSERGAMNMAIDEAVAESVGLGRSPPTVRFYSWSPGAVSIGCFQSTEEVDLDACTRLGVDLVRRRTGGGAVYHDPKGEVTYSIIAPEHLFGRDIPASYRQVCGHVIDALGTLGIRSTFRPVNDIVVDGKKISGSAQTRRGGVLLQHGTLLLSLDTQKMFSLLRPSAAKLSGRNVGDILTSVSSFTDASRDEVLAALRESFLSSREWAEAPLEPEELRRAEELAARYRDEGWTFSARAPSTPARGPPAAGRGR
jgi:lipoate-protein ligase A